MQKMSTMCGTTQYMAPEIVNRDSYRGDKADIWSCGVVLFVLLQGFSLSTQTTQRSSCRKSRAGVSTYRLFISDLARDVILRNPDAQPTGSTGREDYSDHEWFNDVGPAHDPLLAQRDRCHESGVNYQLP